MTIHRMNTGHSIPRPALSRGIFALLLLPLVATCDRPYDGPPVTGHDSAGVRIVEAHVPVWTDSTAWRLDPEPVLDLHALGPADAYTFFRIRGMRRLGDGTLAVANSGTGEIRLFSELGDHIASVGGQGEGPGEFGRLEGIELVGDSIFALDSDGDIAVFGPAPDPTHVRTMSLHYVKVRSLHSLDDGTLVVPTITSEPPPAAPGIVRTPHALLRLDLDGALVDSIGTAAGGEEYTDNVSFSGTPLFPRESIVDSRNGRIYYGSADLMEVRELGPDGELLRVLRIPDYPLELSEELVEAERHERLGSVPPMLRQAIQSLPAPATRPAYRDMLVDPTGAIWLRPFEGITEGGTPLDWQVIDADGTWLGGVTVPTNVRIWDIGVDEVLGSWIDELGQQHPLVFRLRRGGVGAGG
ncbi:MAG: hypothetical protein F4123_03720 [Gemmatimonadetes bacterium]|nr:hypothetical protein [Gemmatimonadota bacterium]MYB98964.1 hypothetical protein [Gemmatimonadota bacterium]MYI45494.1 hypothetical protein [Gemmatimonadota bacterium]